MAVTINRENRTAGLPRGQGLMAAGGLLGALVASSCRLLPLVLFGLGVSGAWIGNLTRLAPYQPFFIAGTIACLGTGTGSSTAHQKVRAPVVKRVRGPCRIGSSSSGSLWRRCSSSRRSASTSSLLCCSTCERSEPHDSNRASESAARRSAAIPQLVNGESR